MTAVSYTHLGRSTAGKTTLCQRINNEELHYYKTQTVQVINKNMIDTPGEYLERRYFRGALMVTAAAADTIVLVQAATEKGSIDVYKRQHRSCSSPGPA